MEKSSYFGLCLVLCLAHVRCGVVVDPILQEDDAECISCLNWLSEVKLKLNTTDIQKDLVSVFHKGLCPMLRDTLAEKCGQLATRYLPHALQLYSDFMTPRWMCWEANLCTWNVTETLYT